MKRIFSWLIGLLGPFQDSYILEKKSLWQGGFTLFETQSIPLSDTAGVKTLGWVIIKMEGSRWYLAGRVNSHFLIKVFEELPFMCPGFSSIFIISHGCLIEYITMRKN
ncbi:MAG: hypothetical protein PHR36_02250 [Patescibacteria group bacterium]|nr:hypothetical protein [Patescibacteria group bacterium]